MKKLLKTHGLPDSKVKCVMMSGEYPELVEAVKQLGIDVIITKPNTKLDGSISTHTDCNIFHIKNTIFTTEEQKSNIVNYLTIGEYDDRSTDLQVISEPVESPYPGDVPLNATVIGDKIICNTKYISADIKAFAQNNGFKLIHTNQGYAGCSTIILNDNALITDDSSIHHLAVSNGIDSIILSKGQIKLSGFDYGFIGGCCGMIDKNRIVFTGNIDLHNDSESIKSFLNKHRVDYICLTENELIDIGGIVPLFE